ncbi:homeobox protein prospero-like [Tachypleus tridentatus]|uniref:homeobox protein prospero-like n=1 Tax=Tachypleus tridentatus TaxID=6853 RepID=UPI003FD356F1
MMSLEEDSEIGSLKAKTKRSRHRVDAGEPRNNYAAIPSFSCRQSPTYQNGFSMSSPTLTVGDCDNMVVINASIQHSNDVSTGSAMAVVSNLEIQSKPSKGLENSTSNNSFAVGTATETTELLRGILENGKPELVNGENNKSQSKRARVEHIVSGMLQGPSNPRQIVNGCKKRKLYQPQQHGNDLDEEEDEDLDEEDDPPTKVRRQEEVSLKVQIRKMQQQLAVMQELISGKADVTSPCGLPEISRGSSGLKENVNPAQSQELDTRSRQSCIVKSSSQVSLADIDGLVEALKTEIAANIPQIIDSFVSKYKQGYGPHKFVDIEPSKDISLFSHILDRKSPRTKIFDRGIKINGQTPLTSRSSPYPTDLSPRSYTFYPPVHKSPSFSSTPPSQHSPEGMTHCYVPPPSTSVGYEGLGSHGGENEQTEPMPLVVTPKKKRHKVTDTRLIPRLGAKQEENFIRYSTSSNGVDQAFSQQPPPLVPVSLPTSVAVLNPSLHHSQILYEQTRFAQYLTDSQSDDSSFRTSTAVLPSLEESECSPDVSRQQENGVGSECSDNQSLDSGLAMTSTLTPMHLRKAKLMFFFVRYPSSAVIKLYFPDIRFNKNNTAQLVKWFSNFREFFYIQVEKYARQAAGENIKAPEDLKITSSSEIMRILNLHYNRNNHIEVPEHFRLVVEQTLQEFFRAILSGKDQEQSWKKAIYKVIARLDETVPDYFKSPNFLEQLE